MMKLIKKCKNKLGRLSFTSFALATFALAAFFLPSLYIGNNANTPEEKKIVEIVLGQTSALRTGNILKLFRTLKEMPKGKLIRIAKLVLKAKKKERH